jgi:hypothetical protein
MIKVISTTGTKATLADIGRKVLVYPNGITKPPIEAVIKTVDELSGHVIEVIVKDANKEERILQVKTRIVALVYEVPKWVKFIINLFKKQ